MRRDGGYRLDDVVDGQVEVDGDAALVGLQRLQGGELVLHQRDRHEVPGPAGNATRDDLAIAVEVDEPTSSFPSREQVAIVALERAEQASTAPVSG